MFNFVDPYSCFNIMEIFTSVNLNMGDGIHVIISLIRLLLSSWLGIAGMLIKKKHHGAITMQSFPML